MDEKEKVNFRLSTLVAAVELQVIPAPDSTMNPEVPPEPLLPDITPAVDSVSSLLNINQAFDGALPLLSVP